MIHETLITPHGGKVVTYIQDGQIYHQVYRKKPAMIICPGGAYLIHATREGEPTAVTFMEKDFQCFVLYYSVGTDREHPEKGVDPAAAYPIQALQLMETVHMIRTHAEEWHIDVDSIFVIGFSAGGHVAASLGTRWNDPKLLNDLDFKPEGAALKPAGVLLAYPMLRLNSRSFMEASAERTAVENTALMYQTLFHTDTPSETEKTSVDLIRYVSEDTAPMFLWNCMDDPVVDPGHALDFVRECHKKNVACEYHLFDHGGHGLASNNALTTMEEDEIDPGISQWIQLALAWIRRRRNERG